MIDIRNKSIIQGSKDWVTRFGSGDNKITIENVDINDGGLVLLEGTANGDISLKNVWNKKSTNKYFVLLWPEGSEILGKTGQRAIRKFTWDNSGCKHDVLQGPNEALARFKCDNLHIIGGRYRAFIKDGVPYKQIMQFRHGKTFLIEGATFVGGWNDHGQQKVAGRGYITDQRVGVVIYDGCTFTTWAPGRNLNARQPGVGKIIYNNCIDPDGKKFSKTV